MPSPVVAEILSKHRRTPQRALVLPPSLTDADFADLAAGAEAFEAVEELQTRTSTTVTVAAILRLATRLQRLRKLVLTQSSGLTDQALETIAADLSGLTSLSLHGCGRVTDAGVRAVAERLSGLTSLDLGGCRQVTDAGVMAVAEKLAGLTSLNLWGCVGVTDAGLGAVAEKLAGLTSLNLGGGGVTDAGLGAVAEKLSGLTSLDLGGCRQVTDAGVRAVAERLSGLTSLDLGGCRQLTDAGLGAVAEKLAGLTSLNLWGCVGVTDAGVMAAAEKLAGLTTLGLSGCGVTDRGVMAVAEKLAGLTSLDLGDCGGVTDRGVMAVAEKLAGLTSLDLDGCQHVTVLPEEIGRLHDLQYLNVRGTSLSALPDSLRSLALLRMLNVGAIPGLGLPAELTADSWNPAAILDHYFRGAREGRRRLNEAKLILVGNEAVGKTSLVNFLVHDKPCSDTPKTPGVALYEGVDVTRWDIASDQMGDNPLRLNVWDFGGQHVYHETHRFFLTARSVYLVVLEARRENENEQVASLRYWFQAIHGGAREAVPVIVVINKAEGDADLKLDEPRLMQDYPVIRQFVRASCKAPKGRNIAELRQRIVQIAQGELHHVRDWLPESYFKVKEKLGKLARKQFVLESFDYRKICEKEKIREEREQNNLLTLLDQIGVVVKYDQLTLLDPNWLTAAVYKLLKHADIAMAGGEFSLDRLGDLLVGLEPGDYPRDRWRFIADMMVRFGLSFELPKQQGRYLVPGLLPVEDAAVGWEQPGDLRFRYDYQDTPPFGLMPRFIVEAHGYLAEPRQAWVSGAMFIVEGCPVLVRIDRHKRKAFVFVRGPRGQRRGALAVVRSLFAEVHRLNHFRLGKEVKAVVPVDVPDEPEAAFDYDNLLTLEEDKTEYVRWPGARQRFRVKELLEGVGPEPAPRRRDRPDLGWDAEDRPEGGKVAQCDFAGPVGEVHIHQYGDDLKSISVHNPGGTMVGVAVGPHAGVSADTIAAGGAVDRPVQVPAPSSPPALSGAQTLQPSQATWKRYLGPAVAAAGATGLLALYLFDAPPKWTALATAFGFVFAAVLLARNWFAWRSNHWPKPAICACLSAATGAVAISSSKLIAMVTGHSPADSMAREGGWVIAAVFVVAALGFGVIQVVRELWGTQPID